MILCTYLQELIFPVTMKKSVNVKITTKNMFFNLFYLLESCYTCEMSKINIDTLSHNLNCKKK